MDEERLLSQLSAVFDQIPAGEILSIGREVQSRIKLDSTLVRTKADSDIVTDADLRIEKLLLEYFDSSELSGSYAVICEESAGAYPPAGRDRPFWLVIDPLDGTAEFAGGGNSWGTMIGVCSSDGRILYSWNLLSNGVIYVTSSDDTVKPPVRWNKVAEKRGLRFDVYDYQGRARNQFGESFECYIGKDTSPITVTECSSSPSAVWAGWQLINREIDGLVWLPGTQGKKNYPCYDLTFLGAVASHGWHVALGVQGNNVSMVCVAPDHDSLEVLWATGQNLVRECELFAPLRERDLRFPHLGAKSVL